MLHTKKKALGLVFSEKKIVLSHCKSVGVNDTRGGATFDHRNMICRIYVKLRLIMLHTKYRSFGCCGYREEDFACIFYCKTMVDDDAPGARPV